MKVGILILMALLIDPGKIGQVNSLKSQAKAAYLKGDFKTAISKYRTLVDSLGVTEDEVRLNLANAYFEAMDTANTAMAYQPLTQSANTKVRSVAHQQLGVLSNRENKHEEALASFKQALKADPTNEDARYNYEMVKKKLEEQKKKEEEQKKNDPNQKEENKDKQEQNKEENKDKKDQKDQKDQKDKQDQQNKEQQDQQKKEEEKKQQEQKEGEEKKEQEKKETPQSVKDKLKEMEMSEEKAQMILEAMKNQEIQYLQQNKRKATKPKDRTKPDW
jgi:Ca-activated chloride channel family protein